jgi:hypothetical protein
MGLTLLAWLGIGWYIGTIGYCPLTDWHWDVKRALGETDLPNSFIKYLLDWVFQSDLNRKLVDTLTVVGLILAVLFAGFVNIKDRLVKKSV